MARLAEGALAQASSPRFFVCIRGLSTRNRAQSIHRRNVINVLLFVAQVARRYFPGSEAQEMLATFLPMVTKEVSCALTLQILAS